MPNISTLFQKFGRTSDTSDFLREASDAEIHSQARIIEQELEAIGCRTMETDILHTRLSTLKRAVA